MTPERSIVTEQTAKELIGSIGQLNTSMAVANEQLRGISIKFDRQEDVNADVEKRLKAEEINAVLVSARVVELEKWKRNVNGFMLAVAVPVVVAMALGVMYFFRMHP